MAKGESYSEFVEKFKPKKTTDDCYTPPKVYEVIKNWACKKYDINPDNIVRPFYPGGDYENYDYTDGAVVLDNPPFSILAKIIDFYIERKIPFFLFAPTLTCLNGLYRQGVNAIISNSSIMYENGATVSTSFLTSFGEYKISIINELSKAIKKANVNIDAKHLPKYSYPKQVVTIGTMIRLAKGEIDLQI